MSDYFANTVAYHLAPISHLLDNPKVTEILVNGPDRVYVEIKGRLLRVKDVSFAGDEELQAACVNLAQFAGKVFDLHHPRFDGRLPDGSRVHVIGPPSAKFLAIAIRKFSKTTLSPNDLIKMGSITADVARFLRASILMKKNIIVSGGTGSGKTTLLSILSSFFPEHERIILLEDTSELKIDLPHVVALEARAADDQGRGQVTMRDLLHSTLRLRPDRIIVGEVRGGEALDLLNALNSGHGGTMVTLHANSALGALSKLETLVLFAGEDMPIRAIRGQVAGAVDMVVQASRFPDGSRKVEQIAEVEPLLDENGNYRVNTLFKFQGRGKEKDGRLLGGLVPVGNKPSFFDEAVSKGVRMEASWFR